MGGRNRAYDLPLRKPGPVTAVPWEQAQRIRGALLRHQPKTLGTSGSWYSLLEADIEKVLAEKA